MLSILGVLPLIALPVSESYTVEHGADRDNEQMDKLLSQFQAVQNVASCQKHIEEWLPPVRIEASALNLEEVSLTHSWRGQEEIIEIRIPLKKPQGAIEELSETTNSVSFALEILRLLHLGKVAAVTVERVSSLDTEPVLKRLAGEILSRCEKSQILLVVKECTRCVILEWNNVKP